MTTPEASATGTSARVAPGSPAATPPAAAPAGSSSAAVEATGDGVPEPTTTNTLPPPPAPSRPAASTAGALSAAALPVPAGWRTKVRKGSTEEGFRGNGTWVHARDPRYAAYAVVTVGCLEVTRDDYPDPTAALEGNYRDADGEPGVGLVLEFADEASAAGFLAVYDAQLDACRAPDGPVQIEVAQTPLGIVDRRTDVDGADWTEVVRQQGRRLTLVILSDPGHRISDAAARRLLEQIG